MNKKLEDKLATHPIKQTSKQEGSASPSGSASPGSCIIFQSWRDLSSFMLAQILIYRSCRQYVASLTEISIHFINYLLDFESPVWTLKRFILLGFFESVFMLICWLNVSHGGGQKVSRGYTPGGSLFLKYLMKKNNKNFKT